MLELSKQKLLVIAPHPDDEVIGCGGLIKKIKDSGGKVYVLFMTVGDTQDFTKKGLSTSNQRLKEIRLVAKFLKYDDYQIAFPGNDYHLKLDLLGQKALMDMIERQSPLSLEKIKPTMVAIPSATSYNQDHRITSEAAHASLRPASKDSKHMVETVLSYEEPADGWTLHSNFEPNFLLPLTEKELNAKIKALKLYKSQLRARPNLRSTDVVKVLAQQRGALCGHQFAEGFRNLRIIYGSRFTSG